ncbi:hypothetical protein SK069_11945 [Patulibacter brassicae]|uniref:Uncharacterized protein n=1 Tax=Patulibacter brassicae TaxID=1705717 RepID=A0ABU4VLS6_9ACTN|nr:hypothetical protein [Patulibacter brassicae]MDX8152312.1 hypothetical protein [Patulibacter brassicae]
MRSARAALPLLLAGSAGAALLGVGTTGLAGLDGPLRTAAVTAQQRAVQEQQVAQRAERRRPAQVQDDEAQDDRAPRWRAVDCAHDERRSRRLRAEEL